MKTLHTSIGGMNQRKKKKGQSPVLVMDIHGHSWTFVGSTDEQQDKEEQLTNPHSECHGLTTNWHKHVAVAISNIEPHQRWFILFILLLVLYESPCLPKVSFQDATTTATASGDWWLRYRSNINSYTHVPFIFSFFFVLFFLFFFLFLFLFLFLFSGFLPFSFLF